MRTRAAFASLLISGLIAAGCGTPPEKNEGLPEGPGKVDAPSQRLDDRSVGSINAKNVSGGFFVRTRQGLMETNKLNIAGSNEQMTMFCFSDLPSGDYWFARVSTKKDLWPMRKKSGTNLADDLGPLRTDFEKFYNQTHKPSERQIGTRVTDKQRAKEKAAKEAAFKAFVNSKLKLGGYGCMLQMPYNAEERDIANRVTHMALTRAQGEDESLVAQKTPQVYIGRWDSEKFGKGEMSLSISPSGRLYEPWPLKHHKKGALKLQPKTKKIVPTLTITSSKPMKTAVVGCEHIIGGYNGGGSTKVGRIAGKDKPNKIVLKTPLTLGLIASKTNREPQRLGGLWCAISDAKGKTYPITVKLYQRQSVQVTDIDAASNPFAQ